MFYIDRGESKQAILMIHGWYHTARDCYAPYIDYFQHSYRIIAPDLPGHGASYKFKGEVYGLPVAYKACEEILVSLSEQVSSVIIMGHSMGAYIALKLALMHPKLVDSLILLSGIADYSPFEQRVQSSLRVPAFLDSVVMRWYAFREKFPFGDRKYMFDAASGHKPPGKMGYYKIKVNSHPHHAAREYLRSFLGSSVFPSLKSIKQPVLLMYGADDKLTPPATGLAIAGQMQKARLKVIDQAGHNLHLRKKEDCLFVIEEFLAERRKKGSLLRRLFFRDKN